MTARPMTTQSCPSGGPSARRTPVMPGAATNFWRYAMSKGSMSHDAADRISAAAAADPSSPTAVSGFDDRAQAAADRNDDDDYDDEE